MTTALKRRAESIRLQQEAAALPDQGPLADLVSEIHAELSRLVTVEAASHEARPFLQKLGRRALDLTGSINGMRVICHRAASMDPRKDEMRRDMLYKAWDGIGDERERWTA